jgi:GMP synthase-like glutamine amidotransferase
MKVALLDLYDKTPNLGIGSILDIIHHFSELEVTVYDVRGACEIPSLDYDIYISSGGPGSPLEGDGVWDRAYYFFLEKLWKHNLTAENKKPAFFICHSFQMVCNFLSLGSVIKRRTKSLGIFPCELTVDGLEEPLFKDLTNPAYVADFREWQVIHPNLERMERLGCKILALEKERPHIDLERAMMAIRFSPEWIGTQFHPEAEPSGMLEHFEKPDERALILEHKGVVKFEKMIQMAEDPRKLRVTHDAILPSFLRQSIEMLELQMSLNLV